MYIVYVLRSAKDNNLYIGCTSDIQERLKQNNMGKVRSTKGRLPFRLVYSEKYADKYAAFKTERLYKTAKGKRILNKKLKLAYNSNMF